MTQTMTIKRSKMQSEDNHKDECMDEDENENENEDKQKDESKDEKDLPPLRVVAPHPATSTWVSIPPKLPLIRNIWFASHFVGLKLSNLVDILKVGATAD